MGLTLIVSLQLKNIYMNYLIWILAIPANLWCYPCTSFLLTIPPSVGYEQNPLSLYYCYDIEGPSQNLRKCIAEVSDTNYYYIL